MLQMCCAKWKEMETPDKPSVKPFPGRLDSLCASVKFTQNVMQRNQDCCRVMGEYGSTVFDGLDKASASATLIGIFATYKTWKTDTYEGLVEVLMQKPRQVIGHLEYIARVAWAAGPEPEHNIIVVAGYAARSLIADLHGLPLKDRRAVLKIAANAASAYKQHQTEPHS